MANERLALSQNDAAQRDAVLDRLRTYVREGRVIRLDRSPESLFAGSAGEFRYLFEGEDDLLHLAIYHAEGRALDPDETLPIARFLLPGVPEAQVWLRPGPSEHHYYLGHDLLLGA